MRERCEIEVEDNGEIWFYGTLASLKQYSQNRNLIVNYLIKFQNQQILKSIIHHTEVATIAIIFIADLIPRYFLS